MQTADHVSDKSYRPDYQRAEKRKDCSFRQVPDRNVVEQLAKPERE
jgi:hypothetical protein